MTQCFVSEPKFLELRGNKVRGGREREYLLSEQEERMKEVLVNELFRFWNETARRASVCI